MQAISFLSFSMQLRRWWNRLITFRVTSRLHFKIQSGPAKRGNTKPSCRCKPVRAKALFRPV